MPKNFLCHSVCMFEHVIVPKPQDANVQLIESDCPVSVIASLVGISVLAAIEFDGQSTGRTVEIQNVTGNAMLAAEPVSG